MIISYIISDAISKIIDIDDNQNQRMTFCLTEHLFAYQTKDQKIKLIANTHFMNQDINENSVIFDLG